MKDPERVYGIWDKRVLELLSNNKDEWFSANAVSEHFKITLEDAFMALHNLERGGSIEMKPSKKYPPFYYKFKYE